MAFLQESLLVKPGVCRDVRIEDHVFRNMAVYERGGKSIESIYDSYSNVFQNDERVSRDTFMLIV